MRTIRHTLFRYCTVAACAAVVANGCVLDRSVLATSGTVTPLNFCPGDTLRASYDFLRSDTCTPSGSVTCETHAPNVVITSDPVSFPRQDFHSYRDGIDFTPAADTVAVTFDFDRETVLIPAVPNWLARERVVDSTLTARRITDMRPETLSFGGMCVSTGVGASAPASLAEARFDSPNLRIVQARNTSPVAVLVTPIDAGGVEGMTQNVPVGMTVVLDAPGSPSRRWRTLRVQPVSPPPLPICMGDGTTTPFSPQPTPLSIVALKGCG